jgi:hypothetical protein
VQISKGGPVVKARYTIYSTAVLDSSIEDVWTEMRDFSRVIQLVFPGSVSDVQWVKGGSVEIIPSVLEFTLKEAGATIREEVVGRSEIDHTLRYRSVGTALSMVDYIGTLKLYLVTDEPDKTFVETTKEFSLVEGTDAAAFLGMYEPLVHQETRAVRAYFAKRKRP